MQPHKRTTYTEPRNLFQRWRTNQKGATAVEIAMLAPVLFAMLFGIFEIGRALWLYNTLQRAAEQAARFAVVNSTATDAEITTQALNEATGISGSNITSTITHDATGGVNFITIELEYDFAVLANLVGIAPVTLSGRSRVPFNN